MLNSNNSKSHRARHRSQNIRDRSIPSRHHQSRRPDHAKGMRVEQDVSGALEIHPRGYGFLRDTRNDFRPTSADPFLDSRLIEHFGLRAGNLIYGQASFSSAKQGPRMKSIEQVDGQSIEDYSNTPHFDDLRPVTPNDWLRLETDTEPLSTRVMDLLAPLGKGQRALLVAPPRSGKTVLLQQIGQAIATNHPDIELVVLLVDERPEEVTEMRDIIAGQVFASSLDHDIASHIRLSQLVVERCKRLAEQGRDVFLLVDSLTRIARAFNKGISTPGPIVSGGLDVRALDIPKRLFAAARAFDQRGSLTIVATALVQTDSRMDEVIFQEFKGTGNMEMVLDRRLAERRIWPAMDIGRSGTRHEERLLGPDHLRAVNALRRSLANRNPLDAMESLTHNLTRFATNQELIRLVANA